MDIRQFITFKKIAEVGNFTKAAEELGYAQSSVTAHIQALESHLKTVLFDRIGKSIELTASGIQLLEYVNELLEVYRKIESISTVEAAPKGTIKIGVPETLMLYRLDKLFKTYKELYPEVTIIMTDTPASRLVEALSKGELDLAFILDHLVDHPDFMVYPLIEEKMCFIYPPDLDSPKLSKLPRELAVFLTEDGCSYRYLFEHALKDNGAYAENIIETWSIETIKRCVMNSIGMSYLPMVTVAQEIKTGLLQYEPTSNEDKKMVSQIAYHKKKWLSPAIKAFLDLTLELAKTWENPV